MLKTFWRTLLLVLLGLLVLTAMAAWVKLTQHQPATGDPLRVTVSRDIIFPWEETELWVDYSGAEGEIQDSEPPPATLLFLLDTSGSMSGYLEDTKRALFEMQRNIAIGASRLRIGVIEFASSTRVISPFTSNMDELAERLRNMRRGAGGGTLFPVGLEAALDMLDAEGGSGTVILLTDGEDGSGVDLSKFYTGRWRPSGHELYLVGVGTSANDPASFYDLTDDPSRYIVTSTDTGNVALLFNKVALHIGNGMGRNVSLHLPLAQPLWDWSTTEESDELQATRTLIAPSARDPERFYMAALFARPYRWRIPLDPKLSGILRTLHEPSVLGYTALNGDTFAVEADTPSLPKVLVITWLFLFMLMLPALTYLLAALLAWLFRRAGEIPELEPVQWRQEHRPPPNLPLRFPPDAQRIDWTPSLLIGLGRSGRSVLTHIRQNLADSFDQPATRPVLLAVDLASDELRNGGGEPVPGCLQPLGPDQVFMLPPESCALYDGVHQQQERARTDSDDPAAALDLAPYDGMGADALRLSKGTQGQPTLARLALLNDLSNGGNSALLGRLQAALEEWRRIAPTGRTRQILLIANVHGGVGAGWLTDLLILLRRLVGTDEAQGKTVEINLLLLGDEQSKRGALVPLDAPVLFAELDRLASAGSRPFRLRLARADAGADGVDAGAGLADALDGWVRKRPQDAIFVLPGRDPKAQDHYPAAADAATLLIDQRRRTELTYQLQAVQGAEARRRATDGRELYTRISIHNAVFPRSFFRELLLERLTNLLGNHQVLFPEIASDAGRPVLKKKPVDGRSLCDPEASTDPLGIIAAVGDAGLGRCAALRRLPLDADSLSEAVNAVRLALISNANRGLRSRDIGLLGLADAAGAMADNLRGCAAELDDSPMLLELADGLMAIRRQALIWIELFFGSQLLVELGSGTVLSGQTGLLETVSADFDRVVESLAAWNRADSRTLVAPVSDADLTDRGALDRKLDQLLLRFLEGWLATDTDLVAALAQRCGWELTIPGSAGESIGINLLLRGTRTRRYIPSAMDLRRFEADLREEAGPVLDKSNDFHLLSMLRAAIDGDDDGERALVPFVAGLKGRLRGERSGLLATLPDLQGIHDPNLHAFRARLVKTLTDLTVNAAERVTVIGVEDRNRMSVLQTLPLLQSEYRVGDGRALHRPEQRLRQAAKGLAEALGRDTVELPPVIGIALEDRDRLRQFARLYANGQVLRHETDDLWIVRDGHHQVRLSAIASQPLADAAAYYAGQGLDIAIEQDLRASPYPDDGRDDFVAYLGWLAEQ